MLMEHQCGLYCKGGIHCYVAVSEGLRTAAEVLELARRVEELYRICHCACQPAREADIPALIRQRQASGVFVSATGTVTQGRASPQCDIGLPKVAWLLFFTDAEDR